MKFVPMIGPEILSIALLSNNFIFLLRLKYASTFDTHESALSILFFRTPLHPTFCKRCLVYTVTKLQEIIYRRNYFYEIYISSRMFTGDFNSKHSEFIYYV